MNHIPGINQEVVMKINKIICDKCKKEIDSDSEVRLDVMSKEKSPNGFSLGF